MDTITKPNVIFVLTDDQGYGDLSCLGNPVLRTPCIDGLYAESVRLADFHVAPVCTPTRGELMTGCDALRNGATFVCMGRSLLRADLPTMPDLFTASGYHTGHLGTGIIQVNDTTFWALSSGGIHAQNRSASSCVTAWR